MTLELNLNTKECSFNRFGNDSLATLVTIENNVGSCPEEGFG